MTNLEEEEGCMEVRNLSYICSTYADMASPIKPADSVKDEIEIFLAITNGPGKENYVYPTGTFQTIVIRNGKCVQRRRCRNLSVGAYDSMIGFCQVHVHHLRDF